MLKAFLSPETKYRISICDPQNNNSQNKTTGIKIIIKDLPKGSTNRKKNSSAPSESKKPQQ
jgi:hypothetical protein